MKAGLAMLAAAVLLAACGQRERASTPAPLAAQPSSEPVAATPPPATPALTGYPALKAAAIQFVAGEPDLRTPLIADDERSIDLVDCEESDRAVDPKGRPLTPLETIAIRIAVLARTLRAAGYPPSLFQPALDRYEAKLLGEVQSSAQPETLEDEFAAGAQQFAAEVNAARLAQSPDLPNVTMGGGCGGGEMPTFVKSDPPGARVWLITKFAFNVCKAKGVDPWDRQSCNRWSEIDPGRPAQLSGAYVYSARWADGSTSRGDNRVEQVPDQDLEQFLVRKN